MGLKEAWFGKDPEIITRTVEDPYKVGVTKPLSTFLAGEVGKGLPRYPGQLYEPLDTETMSRYSEFMGLSAGDLFEEAIGGPETKRFKEEFLPTITEGFAGSLRGSGRFRAEEAGIGRFTEALAAERAKFIPGVTQAQFQMGVTRATYEDVGRQREYTDWKQSLPEFNPILDKALAFLAGPTGRDIITGIDPGRSGWLKDLAQIAAVAVSGGSFGSTTGTTGGTTTLPGSPGGDYSSISGGA